MRFFGRSTDLEGRPAAKIEFRGDSKEVRTPDGQREFRRGVEAKMADSAIFCDTMDVYMDRTIALNKDARKPEGRPDARRARRARRPDRHARLPGQGPRRGRRLKYAGRRHHQPEALPGTGGLKEKQRIQSTHVIYDKRTGEFEAPGPGTTWLYKRKNGRGHAGSPADRRSPSPARAAGAGPTPRSIPGRSRRSS